MPLSPFVNKDNDGVKSNVLYTHTVLIIYGESIFLFFLKHTRKSVVHHIQCYDSQFTCRIKLRNIGPFVK